MIRCIAIDDDPLYLKLLESYFQSFEDLELVGSYTNSIDGIMKVVKQKPDVVLMDLDMPYLDGLESLSTLDDRPTVIMISAHVNQPRNLDALPIDKYVRKTALTGAEMLHEIITKTLTVCSK